jgi:hypothetical protein
MWQSTKTDTDASGCSVYFRLVNTYLEGRAAPSSLIVSLTAETRTDLNRSSGFWDNLLASYRTTLNGRMVKHRAFNPLSVGPKVAGAVLYKQKAPLKKRGQLCQGVCFCLIFSRDKSDAFCLYTGWWIRFFTGRWFNGCSKEMEKRS